MLTWCRSAVNWRLPSSFAASRTRSSPCDTRSRPCVRCVRCWPAFPTELRRNAATAAPRPLAGQKGQKPVGAHVHRGERLSVVGEGKTYRVGTAHLVVVLEVRGCRRLIERVVGCETTVSKRVGLAGASLGTSHRAGREDREAHQELDSGAVRGQQEFRAHLHHRFLIGGAS